jgi:hypothetical protein
METVSLGETDVVCEPLCVCVAVTVAVELGDVVADDVIEALGVAG